MNEHTIAEADGLCEINANGLCEMLLSQYIIPPFSAFFKSVHRHYIIHIRMNKAGANPACLLCNI